MLNSKTIRKLDNWRNESKVKNIDINSIVVNHYTHAETTTLNFNGRLLDPPRHEEKEVVPIVVRELENKEYQLIFGLRTLITYNLLRNKTIPSVITKLSREDLVKFLETDYGYKFVDMNIEDIKITDRFQSSRPSEAKIKAKEADLRRGIESVIKVDKDNYLIDGYITYLIFKRAGVIELPVRKKIVYE